MYNFIFWFFYKYFEWKDKDDSTFVPSCLVFLALAFHAILLYSILRYYSGVNPLGWGETLSYGQRKLIMFPFAILMFFLIWYFYYRKKAKQILEARQDRKALTVKNIVLVLLIMVVPLIIAIRFTNMSVK
jgi:hypothetical protein